MRVDNIKTRVAMLVFAGGFLTAGCGGGDSPAGPGTTQPPTPPEPPAPPPAPSVSRVEVSPNAASLEVGRTQRFSATARASDGAVISGVDVTWSSSNTAVVTIDSGGVATAAGAGTATIRATADGVASSPVTIDVSEPPPATPPPTTSPPATPPPATPPPATPPPTTPPPATPPPTTPPPSLRSRTAAITGTTSYPRTAGSVTFEEVADGQLKLTVTGMNDGGGVQAYLFLYTSASISWRPGNAEPDGARNFGNVTNDSSFEEIFTPRAGETIDSYSDVILHCALVNMRLGSGSLSN